MGTFILPKNQQMVQGFPVNRSYTKAEADALIAAASTFRGVSASAPSNGQDGQTYINSGDNGYYVFYSGSWQLIATLTPAALSFFLLEDGFDLLLETGDHLALQ